MFPIIQGFWTHLPLQDIRIPKGAVKVPYGQLPADFLAKVDDLLKKKKADQKRMDGDEKVRAIP